MSSYFRSVNNGLLDTYQLKSLDGVAEGNLRTAEFIRQNDGRVKVVAPSLQEDNFPMRDSYDIVIRCLGFKFDDSIFTEWVTSCITLAWASQPGSEECIVAHKYELVKYII